MPKTIVKDVRELLEISTDAKEDGKRERKPMSRRETEEKIRELEKEMQAASKMLEFEYAAILRDRIIKLRERMRDR